jgi:4-diphosphocytidyl-2-C-methyl-D-erythritol kinase
VLGRREDGFHELESLVAFAGVGDTVEREPDDAFSLTVEGPFAMALDGANLIAGAADATEIVAPGLALGRFRLVKLLPVAAGLGGGSADAAAALRLMARANPDVLSDAALAALAPRLGSDYRTRRNRHRRARLPGLRRRACQSRLEALHRRRLWRP